MSLFLTLYKKSEQYNPIMSYILLSGGHFSLRHC